MKRLASTALAVLSLTSVCVLSVPPASADHAWTTLSTSPGVTVQVGKSENLLATGIPWDTDGIDACPPTGAADTRCDWRTHVGADSAHMANGVLGVTLDGSAALQSAVVTSDVWWDPVNSPPNTWQVNFDAHYLAVNPADIQRLRAFLRFKHAGVTELTLSLNGLITATHFRFRVAPQHNWLDTPEVGFDWTLEITVDRTTAGGPAMVWLDNIRVVEMGTTLFDDTFSTATSVEPVVVAPHPALQVTPNPTAAATQIRFQLPLDERIALEVFDVRGQRLRVLGDGTFTAGAHQIAWDGRDASGRRAVPGVYFVRLETSSEVLSAKTMLIE